MKDLSRIFVNPFADDAIGLDKIITFSTEHLQCLISNNPGGIFGARITATGNALTALESSATDDQTKLALRKARNQAKDTFRKGLPASLAKINAVIVAKYGPTAPELTECFPKGRSEFNACPDDRVENDLKTLINGLTAHQADLGAPVVADASGLLTTWTAVHTTSASSGGAKKATEAGKKGARENLEMELFKNLLTLALNFPGQPEKLATYMQPSLLENHPASPPAPTPPPPGP